MKTGNYRLPLTTREVIENWPDDLPEGTREALLSACAKRGKYEGFVLSNPPKDGSRRAAWEALMMTLAPVRVSIGAVLMMTQEEKALYDRCCEALKKDLGLFLQGIEPTFRWSLFAHHYDVDKLRDHVLRMLNSGDTSLPIA
jgi:hypothetical protein